MTNKANKETLYDWIFHFNPHTSLWAAVKRDHISEYFNGNYDNVLRGTSLTVLEKLIIQYKGDIKTIDKACQITS